MPAMAILRTPSPASLAPTDRGMFGIGNSREPCRSRLAGDGDLTDAFAGKPGSYGSSGCSGLGIHANPVGAGLLAMAILRTPSPASRAPTDRGMFGIGNSREPCRSRLAGDCDLTDALAGKPGSYGSPGCSGLGIHANPVGAGLLAMAILRTPSPASLAPTDRQDVREWGFTRTL